MKPNDEKYVQVDNGAQIDLGTENEFDLAAREITRFTGGSSMGGAMSMLWGFLDGDRIRVSVAHAKEIAGEAAQFQQLFGKRLSKQANDLLTSLASMPTTARVVKKRAKAK